MKIFVTAIMLALAAPAAAQTAPAQQHRDHSQHQQQGGARHAAHQTPQGQQQGGQPDQHQGRDMQMGCCADRNGNGRMDCCENMAAGAGHSEHGRTAPAQPAHSQGHNNH